MHLEFAQGNIWYLIPGYSIRMVTANREQPVKIEVVHPNPNLYDREVYTIETLRMRTLMGETRDTSEVPEIWEYIRENLT